MEVDLEKFQTRWKRWLGQKTRADKHNWVTLLDSNWIGWASNVLEKHNKNIKCFNSRECIKDYFSAAINCADMRELRKLDNLYCSEMI